MSEPRPYLPIHLGVYWHGVAEGIDGGVRMRSAFGPHVEELANVVDRVTVVAYEPDPGSGRGELTADFVARPQRDNIEVLSLGRFGGRGDHAERVRRVAAIVGPASEDWDVFLFRFGRRGPMVFKANRCPRIVTLVYGAAITGKLAGELVSSRSFLSLLLSIRKEFHLRRVLRRSILVSTDGEDCIERYVRFVPGRRMRLIRHSSRSARFRHRQDDRLTGLAPRFVVVGAVTESKGVLDAVKVVARLRAGPLPGAELHIVGSGPAEHAVRAIAERLGVVDAVTLHGWVPAGPELFTLLSTMDVLLFTSRQQTESFPRVISEAMAHSVLVVATTVGSIERAYRHEEELVLVRPGDIEGIVDAVTSLVADPALRQRILGSAYTRAEESTMEHVVDALIIEISRVWPELR